MGMADNMRETYISLLELLGRAVWVEITTDSPRCTYFFGPFSSMPEAEEAKFGYIEDLESEGANGISVTIKRCNPEELTIYDESSETLVNLTPSLSGQSR